ncbi:hypothetical protein AVEN_222899-1, partial [Araneus ventricosus]
LFKFWRYRVEMNTDRTPPHVLVPHDSTATKPVVWTWDEMNTNSLTRIDFVQNMKGI